MQPIQNKVLGLTILMVPLVLCRDVDKAGFEKFEVCRWRDLSQNAQLKLKCATWRPYDHTVRLDLYEINV